MSLNLNADELAEVTGKVRASAQVRVLRALHIPVLVRPDGKPLVSRGTYDQIMGISERISNSRKYKPNLEALN